MSSETERRVRDSLKFVRVSLENGHLTDVSISMLLVELYREGLKITHQ
jgi:hypothetical protein